MAFGDYLRKNIKLLNDASIKKNASNAFWIVLRDIARQDILDLYPAKIDSDVAVPIYYDILIEYVDQLPSYFLEKLPSNKQERFRVINRNIFTSNAFHTDGLANQEDIKAYKELNEDKKGCRIVFQGGKKQC